MTEIITTYLEMRSPNDLRPKNNADPQFWIAEATLKQWQFNRFFYQVVGSGWQWIDKQSWTDQQWRDYAEAETLRTFAAYYTGSPAGYYELRPDGEGGVEIAYFGLLPAFIGRGFGGVLLTHALQVAWAMNPPRVWLHTCNLDHPNAIAHYLARGMKIYKVEKMPRLA